MLKIDRDNQSFSVLDTPTLADVSITERYDLQEFISNSPDAFFNEIGQTLFLFGKEIEPSKNVQDRIDLLAMDKEGTSVVIELKRGNHKLHMMQAISYAGMISQWTSDDFTKLLDEKRLEKLVDFLEVDLDEINRQQRIILVAEAFDYSLLIGAEWLSERFGVDVTCCRIAVARDTSTNSEYLVCSNVYPAPELAQEAVPRGRMRRVTGKVKWVDWDAALSSITNSAVVAYYRQELVANREDYLYKRILRYRIDGKRRWFMAARNKNAYVWQHGRFDGDVEFWQGRLSRPDDVKPVKNGECLRLFLYTNDDFRAFHQAVNIDLCSSEWLDGPSDEEFDEMEPENGH